MLGLLVALRIVDPVAVERVRLLSFDIFQRISPRETGQFPVAILDVDDRSISELGQWPWPRTTIADLVQKAMEAGAAAVAFDIIFSEPDRLSPDKIALDNPDLPGPIRDSLAELQPNDVVLAEVFANARVVVGQTSVRGGVISQNVAAQNVRQVPHAFLGPDPTRFLLKFPELVQNLPELEDAATGRGVFTVLPDPDGVYRRVPLVMMVQEALRLSLSIELLRIATGGQAFAVRSNDAGIDGVVVGGQLIRTEADGSVWPHFSYSDPNRFISASDLLEDRVPPGRLAGHLLLVGTSAIGLEDFRPTPLGVPMAGVEIHAQLLENVLGNQLLIRPNTAEVREMVFLVGMGLLVIGFAPLITARTLIFSSLVLIGGYIAFTYYTYVGRNVLTDPSYPTGGTILLLMLLSGSNYLREEFRKRQIRGAFGQYVSPDLVSKLADSPEALRLGGDRQDLSVLFSDVRGFTAIAESFRDHPRALTQFMNKFLTEMSNEIMECGGTIDKFMGDAVMAFWNAPMSDPDHARNACRAALGMLAAVRRVNEKSREDGAEERTLDVGIGINTGTCFVGNMGSDLRFDYTALGDPVNLASRLEGQTKSYGVPIVVGEETAITVKGDFALMELDLIRVKGKHLPERVFALLGFAEMAQSDRFLAMVAANDRMLAAYRSGQWADAKTCLAQARDAAQAVGLDIAGYFTLFEDRLADLGQNPVPDGWDGIFDATSK
ncbi:MAG: adenylate/guanylate cyclase domain-containing protein [Pseudomonadota bacterium]